MNLDYLLYDVFTDVRFGGNPLAVFPDAAGLDTPTMQRIARELNLSETVFVAPPSAAARWPVRIFTPAMELPFAGHPTIGTALALADLGRIADLADGIVLEEVAGDVAVSFDTGETMRAMLTTPRLPERLALEATPMQVSDILGIVPSDLAELPTGPITAAYSAGVPFTFVGVRDRETLSRVCVNLQAWQEHLAPSPAPHLVVLTMAQWQTGTQVQMRMFAPLMGIPEDPATGAAAAALAGFLADLQVPADGTSVWQLEQGVDMGRPSSIDLEAELSGGQVTAVRVGGGAVRIGRGTIEGIN